MVVELVELELHDALVLARLAVAVQFSQVLAPHDRARVCH